MISKTSTYLYLINLNDDISCHNFALPTALQSTLFVDLAQTQQISKIYTTNPDDLALNADYLLQGFSSPCATTLVHACWIRKNVPIYDGHFKPITFSEEEKKKILFKADLEIELEKIRQKKFGTLPSRISSFYLADNNENGRLTLQNIFGERVSKGEINPQIMSVRVKHLLSAHTADIRWLDEFIAHPLPTYLSNYWEGVHFDHYPRLEHIIEGQIYPSNPDDITNIRTFGKLFEMSKNHFLDLSTLDFTIGNWLI